MTPARFRTVLTEIDRSERWVARQIGSSDRMVRRWTAGEYPVPARVGDWLEAYITNHKMHPAPIPPTREEWLGTLGRPKAPPKPAKKKGRPAKDSR